MTVTYAICFALGCIIGWIGHRAEVAREQERNAALGKVFRER